MASRAIAPTAGKWENDQSVAATGTSALMIEAARAIEIITRPSSVKNKKSPSFAGRAF
ncbi:MAG: hypothetical protein ACI8Z5_002801 [Lentimonas sp.]